MHACASQAGFDNGHLGQNLIKMLLYFRQCGGVAVALPFPIESTLSHASGVHTYRCRLLGMLRHLSDVTPHHPHSYHYGEIRELRRFVNCVRMHSNIHNPH